MKTVATQTDTQHNPDQHADATRDPDQPTPAPALAPAPAAPLLRIGKEGLFSKPLRTKDVEVPGYGIVTVRELKGSERGPIDHAAVKRINDQVITDYRGYKEKVLAHCLLNTDGSQMFDKPTTQWDQVAQLPTTVIDMLYVVVDEMSAITKRSQEALGKVTAPTISDDTQSS